MSKKNRMTRQGVRDLNSIGKVVKAASEDHKHLLCDHEYEFEFGVLTCNSCGLTQEVEDDSLQ